VLKFSWHFAVSALWSLLQIDKCHKIFTKNARSFSQKKRRKSGDWLGKNRITDIKALNIVQKVNLEHKQTCEYVWSAGKWENCEKSRENGENSGGTSTIQNLMVRKFWLFYFENGMFLPPFFVFSFFCWFVPFCLHSLFIYFAKLWIRFPAFYAYFRFKYFSSAICFWLVPCVFVSPGALI